MAGYSGTPLPKKLGIKPGHVVTVLNGPAKFGVTLGELPESVTLRSNLRGSKPVDVALLFAIAPTQLRDRFPAAQSRIAKNGGLWVCWPKRSSGVVSDLSENEIREYGLDQGLVDNKVCAIDETWSGLRFVWRLEDR